MDSQIRYPESKSAGDDPCILSVYLRPVTMSAQPTDKEECHGDVAVTVVRSGEGGGGGEVGGEVVSCSPGGVELLAGNELVVVCCLQVSGTVRTGETEGGARGPD